MTIIRNAEIFFLRADPKRPNTKFDKEKPTWDCQLRTYDAQTKKFWEQAGLKMTPVLPEKEGEKPYWKTSVRKPVKKADKTDALPVKVVNGKLEPIDPNTVGNGSIGNIELFQYPNKGPRGGVSSILTGIQITKHIVRKAVVRESFEETDTEVVDIPDEDEGDPVDPAPKTPSAPTKAADLPEGF